MKLVLALIERARQDAQGDFGSQGGDAEYLVYLQVDARSFYLDGRLDTYIALLEETGNVELDTTTLPDAWTQGLGELIERRDNVRAVDPPPPYEIWVLLPREEQAKYMVNVGMEPPDF